MLHCCGHERQKDAAAVSIVFVCALRIVCLCWRAFALIMFAGAGECIYTSGRNLRVDGGGLAVRDYLCGAVCVCACATGPPMDFGCSAYAPSVMLAAHFCDTQVFFIATFVRGILQHDVGRPEAAFVDIGMQV